MSRPDQCFICKFELSDDICYFSWRGAPFSTIKKLCSHCGYLLKPKVINNIAIIGTYDGDIFTLSEMTEEGFDEKKRVLQSIKSMGKFLAIPDNILKKKMK